MVLAKLEQPPLLCLVTDRTLLPPNGLAQAARKALEGGVSMLQLREKDLNTEQLIALAQELRLACEGRALFIVNGNVTAAVISDADGVHLPEDGPTVTEARRLLGEDKIVGRSVHDLKGAIRAQEEGADYLIVGTIFPTRSHPDKEPEGLALLRSVAATIHIPMFGVGGINKGNAASVLAAGASGVAVISSVLSAADPGQATKELLHAMDATLRP